MRPVVLMARVGSATRRERLPEQSASEWVMGYLQAIGSLTEKRYHFDQANLEPSGDPVGEKLVPSVEEEDLLANETSSRCCAPSGPLRTSDGTALVGYQERFARISRSIAAAWSM